MYYEEKFTTVNQNIDKQNSDETKAASQGSLDRVLSVLSRKKLLISVFFMLGFVILSSTVFAQNPDPAPFPGTIEERRDWIIDDLANRDPDYVVSSTTGILVAKVLENIDRDWALSELSNLLDKETTDALQIHQAMHAYLLIGDEYYTQEMIDKLDSYFDTPGYDWPDFCSENFFYSHWATGYMVGEYLPHVVDADGNSGDDLVNKMRDKLYGYFDDIVNRGFGEFGSANYAHHTYDAIRMLAEHAKDPDMKNRAEMILDWFWANWAIDWHDGYLVTASSRDKTIDLMHANPSNLKEHTLACWVYMGAHRQVEDFGNKSSNMTTRDGYHFWAIYEGPYDPPQIALDINNTAKDAAYESKKRSYYDLCHREMRVNRTAFFEENWGLASMCFNNVGNKGSHGEGNFMQLNWDSPHDANMFWVTKWNNHKPYLTGDKFWAHRIMQHERTMVGTVTSAYQNDTLYAAFSKSGAIEKRVEEDGWVFCHTGVNLFAFKTVKSWYWDDDHDQYNVLRSDYAKNGWILETADLSDYAGGGVDAELDAFRNDVLTNSSIDDSHIDEEDPRLIYTSIHGYEMDNTWYNVKDDINDNFKVDGTAIDYESYKQLDSPWTDQEINSGLMTLNHNGEIVDYDFNNWTISGGGGGDTTPPDAPVNLSATAGSGSVSLDWDNNSESDLAGYNVYRSTTSGSDYSQVNGSMVSNSDYTDNDVTNGTTYYYVVTAVDDSNNESGYSNEASATPESSGSGEIIAAINSGGSSFTANDGVQYEADNYFSGGNTYISDDAVSGTEDDALYQSERWGSPVSYNIPVSDGDYEVTLKFAEIYHTSSGSRVFDVSIEGTEVITDLDIYATVGHDASYDVTHAITVSDGELNIDFTADVDNAKVSAILVESISGDTEAPASPANLSATGNDGSVSLDWDDNSESDLAGYNVYRSTTSGSGYSQVNGSLVSNSDYTDNDVTNGTTYYYVVTAVDDSNNESGYSNEASATPESSGSSGDIIAAINSGGSSFTADDGIDYEADNYYSGGSTYSTNDAISGTTDDPLYQSERYDNAFSYDIPVSDGDYEVTLKFAEVYFTSSGKRVFDVSMEGTEVISDLDIYDEVGHDAALDYTLPVTVSDGELNIGFSADVNNAKVSAILIEESGTKSASLFREGKDVQKPEGGFDIYPNPLVHGELTVNFGGTYEDAKVVVHDMQGVVVYQSKVSGDETNISAEEFPVGGVYVISVFSDEQVDKEILIVR